MPKKGYTQTKEHKENQRQSHLGLIQSIAAKEKNRQKQLKRYKEKPISEKTKEKLRKKLKGNKNALNYKYTVKQKEKRRLQVLKQFKNGMLQITKDKIRKKTLNQFKDGMPEKTKIKIRKKQIEYLQKHHIFKNTSIEIKIQNELKRRNIKFEKQKPLLNKYLVDIFIKPNIVIECDGDYWHNRPGAQENDTIRNNELRENEFDVYRFWEHEINNSSEKCINRIFENGRHYNI